MRKNLVSIFVMSFFLGGVAQALTPQEAIKAQAGCYKVTFKFAETFPVKKGYQLRQPQKSGGIEWIGVDYDQEDEIHLQHILVINGESPLKHWRQEWTYNADSLISFKGDGLWRKEPLLPGNNLWTQKVFQVDDSPRYSCAAPWVTWGDNAYWECQSWNPLPRREFSTRNDYNVLQRRNRHQLTSYGWVHEQDNLKLLTQNEAVVEALVKEKGENTYERIDDSRCEIARTWWQKNKPVWNTIQSAWRDVYQQSDVIRLKGSVDNTKLWQKLFDFAEQSAEESLPKEDVKSGALEIIYLYMH